MAYAVFYEYASLSVSNLIWVGPGVELVVFCEDTFNFDSDSTIFNPLEFIWEEGVFYWTGCWF